MTFSKYACICLLVACGAGCKADRESKVAPDYLDFMTMNIFQSGEFSLPPYYPLKDVKGQGCRLDSALKRPTLVFRFSEHNCDACIESELALMNKLNISKYVVGLGSYGNLRMFKLAQQKFKMNFPIYFLPFGQESILPEANDELGRPYLFLMGVDCHAKHLFFPSKLHLEMSERYYQEILHLLEGDDSTKDFFSEKVIDLGSIVKGKTYQAKFKYTNVTSGSLVIQDIKSSCGCTVPQWDRKPLTEGTSSELVVSFTPEALGYNSKIIMVDHNKSKHPLRLIIKANVKESGNETKKRMH